MKQKYISIDVALCHDCNNCFMACKDEHVGNDWPGYTAAQPRHGHRWINIERRERGQYARNDVAYLPTPCQHCQNAHCQKAAPDAITIRPDGVVMIDPVKAKGRKEIVDSCPFGAIYWNEQAGVPQKCTMCAHLLDDKEWKPGLPRCVHSCPTGAMGFYEMEPAEFEKLCKQQGFEGFRSERTEERASGGLQEPLQVHQELRHCWCADGWRLLRERHRYAEEQGGHTGDAEDQLLR